ADAWHAQRDHASYLHRRGACYLLIVQRNQPGLHAQAAALPWRDVPKACDKREHGHGRTGRRTLKVTSAAAGLAFPVTGPATRIRHRRKLQGKWSRETCYAVTSLTLTQVTYAPARRHHPRPPGALRTGCTGPAAPASAKAALRSAPRPARASWPACATWPSPSCGCPGDQHRRRFALSPPAAGPATTDDRELLNDFCPAPRPRPYGGHVSGVEKLRIDTGEAVISVSRGGTGPGVLLLHGFPQTQLMWRDIAPRLAQRVTVGFADLRGYGDRSTPPSSAGPPPDSKPAMGRRKINLMGPP